MFQSLLRQWPVLIFCGAMFLLGMLHDQLNPLLNFQREKIEGGEYWRMFSANFVHLNTYHALLNALGTVVVACLFDMMKAPLRYLGLIVFSSFVVGLGLLLFSSPVMYYVGFSGVLHGLLVYGALQSGRVEPKFFAGVLLVVLLKIVWEQSPFYDAYYMADKIGDAVIADAHLYGAIAGGICWILFLGLEMLAKEKKRD